MTDVVVLVDIIIVLLVMLSASRSDIAKREVSDRHWQILAVSGPVLFFIYCVCSEGLRWEFAANLLGMLCAALCFTAGDARQDVVMGAVSVVMAAMVLVFGDGGSLSNAGVAAQVMVFAYFLLYMLGVLRGGADAKCLIALSVSLPIYYDVWNIPLVDSAGPASYMFVPSLSILLFGAMVAALWCVGWCLLRMDGKKRRGLSCVMDIGSAEKAFVWPLEDVKEGKKVRTGTCSDEDMPEVYARLRDHGEAEVEVSYMIPFIAPLTVATVFTLVVGNPLFLI